MGQLPKEYRFTHLNRLWLEAMIMLISGQVPSELDNEICGLCVNKRQKADRICLWTKTSEQTETIKSLGLLLKQNLNLTDETVIGFYSHAKKQRGDLNPMFTL